MACDVCDAGLQRKHKLNLYRECALGFAIGLFPLLAYPLTNYRRKAHERTVLHTWMSSDDLPQVLRRLRWDIAIRTVATVLVWAACLAPVLLRFVWQVKLRVSMYVLHCGCRRAHTIAVLITRGVLNAPLCSYETVVPSIVFVVYWILRRAAYVSPVPWIKIRRQKREVESLSVQVVRLSTNATEMLPMWTVMRGVQRVVLVPGGGTSGVCANHQGLPCRLLPTVWWTGLSSPPTSAFDPSSVASQQPCHVHGAGSATCTGSHAAPCLGHKRA